MSKKAWEQIEALAREYSRYIHAPEKEKYKNEIELTFSNLFLKLQAVNQIERRKLSEEENFDLVTDFLRERLAEYDPDIGPFEHYFRKYTTYKEKDAIRKRNDLHRYHNKDAVCVSLDEAIKEEETTTREAFLQDPQTVSAFEMVELQDQMIQIAAIALTIPDRLRGKANNPTRIRYFRSIFADGISTLIKNENLGELLMNCERDVFQAMQLSFLDFYMKGICRSVAAIENTPLRDYGELVEGEKMESCCLPLPGNVYMAYWENVEHQKVTAANVSQMKRAYRAFFAAQMKA